MSWAGGGYFGVDAVYSWELADPLGTGQVSVDEQGARVRHNQRTPFGGLYSSVDDTGRLPQYYAGHRREPTTGLIYMNARWYDPGSGRFLSIDPVHNRQPNFRKITTGVGRRIQFQAGRPSVYVEASIVDALRDPQLLNAYSYVSNRPTSMVDPTGEFGEATVVGALAGWATGAGYEAGRQLGAGEELDIDKILDSAWNGGLRGAAFGLAVDAAVALTVGFVVIEGFEVAGVSIGIWDFGSFVILGGAITGLKVGQEEGEKQQKVLVIEVDDSDDETSSSTQDGAQALSGSGASGAAGGGGGGGGGAAGWGGPGFNFSPGGAPTSPAPPPIPNITIIDLY